jgi:hypothetical protein
VDESLGEMNRVVPWGELAKIEESGAIKSDVSWNNIIC